MTVHPSRTRARAALALPLLAVLAGAGCGAGHRDPARPAAAPGPPSVAPVAAPTMACKQPSPPDLPDAAGQVAETDTGAFCLADGKQIDAFLTAPGAQVWAQITSSDLAVLAPGDNSMVSTPMGVTAGIFVGRAPGIAVLKSTLPDGRAWSVTVVVL